MRRIHVKKKLFYFLTLTALMAGFSWVAKAGDDDNRVEALLKKGIRFQTKDGKYSLTINPQIQIRYANDIIEGAGNDAHSIMVRRAYVGFSGHAVTEAFTYNLRLNILPGANANDILYYAWLNYKFTDSFNLLAGLHKLAFNRQEMTSDGKLQFIDRSLANERYNLDRSIGLMARGKPGNEKIEYYLTIANGRDTRTAMNANQELAYLARVVFNPLGDYGNHEGDIEESDEFALTVGLGGELHHEETTVSANQDQVITGTGDVGFKYQGFSFETGAFYRATDPGAAAATVTDFGYYAQAGYFFLPKKFEIALRVSSLFDDLGNDGGGVYFNNGSLSNLGGAADAVDEGTDSDNEHEYSLALNYYFSGHKVKLQGQYTFMLDGQAGADELTNHLVMAQIQLEL